MVTMGKLVFFSAGVSGCVTDCDVISDLLLVSFAFEREVSESDKKREKSLSRSIVVSFINRVENFM